MFGEPSFQTPPVDDTSFLAPPKAQRRDSANDLGFLDEGWIYIHLEQLNEGQDPVLDRSRLLRVQEDVVGQLWNYLGRPVKEVWEEIRGVLATALFQEKYLQPEEQVGNMAAPVLGQFLGFINGFIHARNEAELASYLTLEPPFGDLYMSMIQELKQTYAKGNEEALEEKCSRGLPAAREGADGTPWTPFVKFMVQYLGYLRDVDADPTKYLQTYELLSELQSRANSALTHAVLGYLMLPIVVTNAKLVCRLAIGLDRKPELIAHLKSDQPGSEDGGPKETLPERAANILRQAFVTCLNDRTPVKNGKPEGRKRGIYIIANICLKILFQCRKTRNATQIFENIYNLSPPLSSYPKRERVTYLYYLGRFMFQNSHFYLAQLALQQAYDESPARQECVRQRRHILVYLIASNIVLGRFPSQDLLNRPEARGLAERFMPLCFAIRQGNLAAFHQHLDVNGPHADWFLHLRILLQLKNRCEVLVWRSLVRKTWMLNGTSPDPATKRAPTVDIHDLSVAFSSVARSAAPPYADPDFEGVTQDFPDSQNDLYEITHIESILSSLIDQGLLGGYFSHKMLKFAITGTKQKGSALAAGFPQPWEVMRAKAVRGAPNGGVEVPGWKTKQVGIPGVGGLGAGVGPGMVVNLSGVRPVGAVG